MSRAYCNKFKRTAVFLAIFGLLFQAALVALSIPAAFSASIPKVLPTGYTSIFICTGAGMQRIVIDTDGNRVEQEDQNPSVEYCSACILADSPVLAINTISPQILTVGYHLLYPAPGTQVSAEWLYAQCPESRGPPLYI